MSAFGVLQDVVQIGKLLVMIVCIFFGESNGSGRFGLFFSDIGERNACCGYILFPAITAAIFMQVLFAVSHLLLKLANERRTNG